jgi:peptidyl-prolyl cis-trans isomerase C
MISRVFLIALSIAAAAVGCRQDKDNGEDKPAATGASGVAPAQTPTDLDAPLAKIDDVVITVGEFQDRINRQSPYVRGRYTSRENQREFLTNLIRFEVLAIEARRRGLDKDPDAIRAMKQVMIQKLMAAEFENAGRAEAITEAELQAHYDNNPNQYNRPEEVRVAAIVVRGKAAAATVAKQALGEVGKTNKGFRDLVYKHSVDQESKIRGGDLRFFSRDNKQIPKPVIDAAFALESTGAVAGPIDAGDGTFYIIKQTGKRKAIIKPFDKVKLQIRNRLARQKRSAAQRDFIADLKQKSAIELYENNLGKVEVDQSKTGVNRGHGDGDEIPGLDPDKDTGGDDDSDNAAAPSEGVP